MKTNESPEPLLLEILAADGERIRDFAIRWVKEYTNAGECALAFDSLAAEIEDGHYKPSVRAWGLIELTAKALDLPCPTFKE